MSACASGYYRFLYSLFLDRLDTAAVEQLSAGKEIRGERVHPALYTMAPTSCVSSIQVLALARALKVTSWALSSHELRGQRVRFEVRA